MPIIPFVFVQFPCGISVKSLKNKFSKMSFYFYLNDCCFCCLSFSVLFFRSSVFASLNVIHLEDVLSPCYHHSYFRCQLDWIIAS